MAPPERRILLPKLAAEAPGENDQVLPAASKRRVLPLRTRNAPGARPKCHQCKNASMMRPKFAPGCLSTLFLPGPLYAHYEPPAATLPTELLDEALRIYDDEKDVDCLTTVTATSLMTMTLTTLGKDEAGRRLQEDNARMAQRMQLHGESDDSSQNRLDLSDEYVEREACVAAWGSFNFQMVIAMSYYQEPKPRRAPGFRIPGKTMTAAWHNIPSIDTTYTYVCQFWLIVFDLTYLYYSEKSFPMSSAVAIFQRLLAWADALPAAVQRHESNPDHVLNIQWVESDPDIFCHCQDTYITKFWFHTAIIDLFRPLEHEFPLPKLPTFAGVNAIPKAAISASIEQLKRLVYQSRANCESSKYSIIWQSGMLYLVNHILRNLSSNESQFYSLLCMRGYQHLARYIPFVSGIVKSLIAMTKRQGVPLTSNTQRLLEEVRDEIRSSREFFSTYPVDLEMVAKDPSSATLEKLTSRFQEEPSGAGEGEASDGGSLPDGWKGTVQDQKTTLSMTEDG